MIEQYHWAHWDERGHWMPWRRQTNHAHHGKWVRYFDESKKKHRFGNLKETMKKNVAGRRNQLSGTWWVSGDQLQQFQWLELLVIKKSNRKFEAKYENQMAAFLSQSYHTSAASRHSEKPSAKSKGFVQSHSHNNLPYLANGCDNWHGSLHWHQHEISYPTLSWNNQQH